MTQRDADARASSAPAWLEAALARGRAAWPEFAVSAPELAAAIAAHLADDPADRTATLPSIDPVDVDVAELYLACACRRGDPAALIAFRQRYFAPLRGALTRMGLGDAQRDDLWQALSERLLIGVADAPPRIVGYAGRGELHGLVKVAATRLALDHVEREQRRAGDDAWLDDLPGAASDPELHRIKQQHREELKQEVELVVAELGQRDRALLRLSLVERLGVDAIARSYGVHRATVARWIASARETLAERIRARLAERWHVSGSELAEVRTLVDSQLDLSLERLLAARYGEVHSK